MSGRASIAGAARRACLCRRSCQSSVDARFAPKPAERIKALFAKGAPLDALQVNELMAALVTSG